MGSCTANGWNRSLSVELWKLGCERAFLATLLDRHSIPAQILEEAGAIEGVV
jgi:hypothetical protein